MKRQRSMPGNGTTTVAKRAKRKGKDVVVVVEERRNFMAVAQEILMDWVEWSRSSSSSMWVVGDEQMSWGTCWFPLWDMELMGEAYNALYSDVVWDEDIWDLKAIKEIPNSRV